MRREVASQTLRLGTTVLGVAVARIAALQLYRAHLTTCDRGLFVRAIGLCATLRTGLGASKQTAKPPARIGASAIGARVAQSDDTTDVLRTNIYAWAFG